VSLASAPSVGEDGEETENIESHGGGGGAGGAWHGRPGRQSSYCAVGVAAWPVEAAPGPSPAIAPMTIGSHARPAYVSNSFGSSPETSNRRS
jgi:hypothetical protein